MKLWSKEGEGKAETADIAKVQELTAFDDHLYDSLLLPWDCLGSAAHAKGLLRLGVLTDAEAESLIKGLSQIYLESYQTRVEIPKDVEDCHSYIEFRLTKELGDIGKKIHTGRSRNDQVITALRLFTRSTCLDWISKLGELTDQLLELSRRYPNMPLPGYTHLQRAMPSSISMWLHAFIEGSLTMMRDGISVFNAINLNPLGSAAGFGSGWPLDREYTGKLMGFDAIQRSFIDIQNSRGRMEEKLLFWATQIGGIFEKFAWDIELYFTEEFGCLKLSEHLTTGSSIMPQKRNPDLVELLRARCSGLRGMLSELQWVAGKLPSNYHRDFQRTKAPLFRGAWEISGLLQTAAIIIRGMSFDETKLNSMMTPEIFATYAAYENVKSGVPFREAYKDAALKVESGAIIPGDYQKYHECVINETLSGIRAAEEELAQHKKWLEGKRLIEKQVRGILGR